LFVLSDGVNGNFTAKSPFFAKYRHPPPVAFFLDGNLFAPTAKAAAIARSPKNGNVEVRVVEGLLQVIRNVPLIQLWFPVPPFLPDQRNCQ